MKTQSECPQGFKHHTYEVKFSYSNDKCERVWNALQQRETFVDSQFPPYKVEFDAPAQHGPFKQGELNIHHGPGLSVHGAIGEVREDYRDLSYFYGSYVLSFRLIRPTRLEFFRVSETEIKLKIQSYVKPWFFPIWHWGNVLFWKLFGITFIV